MKNSIIVALCVCVLSQTSVAFAQVYTPYSNSCASISRDLVRGSRGADVTALQQFLLTRNYPGAGSWMITGNFGAATQAAVRNFQTEQMIPVTGWVDSTTRLAIDRACTGAPVTLSTPYSVTTYPYQNQFFQNPIYTSYTPSIVPPSVPAYTINTSGSCQGYNAGYFGTCPNTSSSISYVYPTSGAVGSSVTIFGNGFSTSGNTVHFGSGIITNLTSVDGHSVSFVVPSQVTGFGSQPIQLGTYNVSVTNASGNTTGSLPFSVNSLGSVGTPNIANVNGPTSLAVGTLGSWTLTTNNFGSMYATASVVWGDENLYYSNGAAAQNLYNQNGTQTTVFTHTYSQAGTYTIIFRVSNGSGASTQTSLVVTVSQNGTYSGGTPNISTISPLTGSVGTQLVITGSGFSNLDNTVHFGAGGTAHLTSSNGSTLYYTIPYAVSPCDIVGQGCSSPSSLVVRGTYPLYITNAQGTSNTIFVNVQ